MNINVNGESHSVTAATLAEALVELGFGCAKVATAVNEGFVPVGLRAGHTLNEGDRLEILAPMQGG